MSFFDKFKTIAFSEKVSDLASGNGKPLYTHVRLNWSEPKNWNKGEPAPKGPSGPCLYILMRDHGNALTKKIISYVGITDKPAARFGNHSTAKSLVERNGQASISYAPIDFISGRNKIKRTRATMEQVEHILIWSLDEYLENNRKMLSLPGTGLNKGIPFHIQNSGFRFHGRMPTEILYPTISSVSGRDRSAK